MCSFRSCYDENEMRRSQSTHKKSFRVKIFLIYFFVFRPSSSLLRVAQTVPNYTFLLYSINKSVIKKSHKRNEKEDERIREMNWNWRSFKRKL